MNEDSINKEIKRITKPIFDEVLKETDKNQMLVGKSDKKEPKFVFVNLHNYRRWFDFNRATYRPPTNPQKRRDLGYHTVNYGSEDIYDNFMGCSIKVKKKTIQITNKIEHKRWYAIDMYRGYESVANLVWQKETECVGVIQAFIKQFKGVSGFSLINHKQETKVKFSPITERLSEGLTWHTDLHKKVYHDKVVEIYDLNHAIRLIDNSTIYDNIPELAEPLRVLANGMKQILPKLTLTELKERITRLQDVPRYRETLQQLDDPDKFEMMKHIKLML